jgi:hypothetical protein
VRDLLTIPGPRIGTWGTQCSFDFEALGEPGEFFGDLLGDMGVGVLGAENVVVAEEGAE